MNILVVENEAQWRMALKDMYLRALGRGSHTVEVAGSIAEARNALRVGRHDIMSLDINMALTTPQAGAGSTVDACGLDLLHYAHRQGKAEAVIVISGCTWDTKLAWVIDSEDEEIEIRANMAGILESTFGNRGRFFPKPDPALVSMEASIAVWQNTITKGYLHSLAEGGLLATPYVLDPGHAVYPEEIVVKSRDGIVTVGGSICNFIWQLYLRSQEDGGISHEGAALALLGQQDGGKFLANYQGRRRQSLQSAVHHYVNRFKDDLIALGIDPCGIIEKWRRGGWRIAAGVKLVDKADRPHAAGGGIVGYRHEESKRWNAHRRSQKAHDFEELADDEIPESERIAAEEYELYRNDFLAAASDQQKAQFAALPEVIQDLVVDIYYRGQRGE